jgi:hypothetical protein
MDARKVETSSVDMRERKEALPVMDAAPFMAKGAASVKPAGGAEKATAARPEALEPEAHDEVGTPSRDFQGNTYRRRLSDEHLQVRDCRGKDKSEYRKNATG